MSVTVFLSNTNIQIVVGGGSAKAIKVKRLVSVSVPGGAVLNGVVMDENALVAAIKECWKLNKLPKNDVVLILNSPQLHVSVLLAVFDSFYQFFNIHFLNSSKMAL